MNENIEKLELLPHTESFKHRIVHIMKKHGGHGGTKNGFRLCPLCGHHKNNCLETRRVRHGNYINRNWKKYRKTQYKNITFDLSKYFLYD